MNTSVPSVATPQSTTAEPTQLSSYRSQEQQIAAPETVRKMRLRRGMTLAQISEAVGKQPSWASKIEKGKLDLKGEDLEAYASILEVPTTLLTIDLPSVESQGMMFRKYRVPQKTVDMLEAEASIRLHVIDKVLEASKQKKAPTFKQYRAENDDQVVQVAHQIRAQWGVSPDQPLTNIAGYLESEGIILTGLPIQIAKVNGVSYWHDEQTAPLVMLTHATTDNTRRFTLAHEYAHLVLDKYSPEPGDTPKYIEDRADLFAGELLAPYESIKHQFLSLKTGDLDGLMNLSRYWGLHPKSFVTRASLRRDISKDQASSWYKRLNGSYRHIINNEAPPYPVRFTAMSDILNYLRTYSWNLKSLLAITHVSKHDLEAVVGVDNEIMALAGRPALRVMT
ncbi:XRE family transcriptional regulator [Rothia nasimurium]|uniref:XRE family transcriptional regulator n=1 Tax=Rothia nasimurium TaxID=85336 RepID=UPI00361C23E0